jgi:CHAD domain-containing protein
MQPGGGMQTTIMRFGPGSTDESWLKKLVSLDPAAPVEVCRRYRLLLVDSEDGRLYRAGLACFLKIEQEHGTLSLEPISPGRLSMTASMPCQEALTGLPTFPGPFPGTDLARGLAPVVNGVNMVSLWESDVGESEFHLAEGPGRQATLHFRRFYPVRQGWAEFAYFALSSPGESTWLEKLANRIGDSLGWEPWMGTLLDYAAETGAFRPPLPLWEKRESSSNLSFWEFAYSVLRQQAGRIRWNEPGTRLGLDPEYLHDMRVAARRLRSALRLFHEIIPARRVTFLRREVKWLATLLGQVRDLDIYLARLESLEERLQETSRESLQPFRRELERKRETQRRVLLRSLNSVRVQVLFRSLMGMLHERPIRRLSLAVARSTAGDAGGPIVGRLLTRFLRAGRRLGPASSDASLHALRIQAKRLRYALEFFQEGLGSPAQSWIERLRQLQDLLGEHQDLIVGQQAIQLFLKRGGGGRTRGEISFALGQVSAFHSQRASECRLEFARMWSALDRKKVRQPLERALPKRGKCHLKPSRTQDGDDQPEAHQTCCQEANQTDGRVAEEVRPFVCDEDDGGTHDDGSDDQTEG